MAQKAATKKKGTRAVGNKDISAKRPVNKKKKGNQGIKISTEPLDKEFLVNCGWFMFWAYVIILAIRYVYCFIWVEKVVITTSPVIIFICCGLPFALWVYSTKFDEYNFWKRKIFRFYACVFSTIGTLNQITMKYAYEYLATGALKRTVTKNMTENMILTSARIRMAIPVGIVTALLYIPVRRYISSEIVEDSIKNFKLKHIADLRENKEWKYDLHIVRDLNTGHVLDIKEDDRFVHVLINGQSGTGKTSSTILPAVCEDLNQKCTNMEKRHEELIRMIKEKKAYVDGPYAEVNEYNVKPKKKYVKEYEEIYKKYPDCGMTIMAPNNDVLTTIVKLCDARGIDVNVIDPTREYTEKVAHKKGVQNFYIPFGLEEDERTKLIISQAKAFSEVVQATNERYGKTETYFRDINMAVTTNVAIVCMLAANINGEQTNINEIHRCVTNFSEIEEKVKTIEDYYEISIKASGKVKSHDQARENLERNKNTVGRSKGEDNPYYATIMFVKDELLGAGKEQMFNQARGLRNLLNNLLLDPSYRKILSAEHDNAVDFDEMFAKNQITVVNTAMEIDQELSTALGLIFMLNLQNAGVRRPKDKLLSDHFFWVDEAPHYLHPCFEVFFVLLRQHRVSCGFAIQSLSQMEKSRDTAFLKKTIQGAGTHIVFGRLSSEEMKIYEEIGGVTMKDTTQTRTTSSSYFAENLQQTTQEATVQEEVSNVSASRTRIKDFQEVTLYRVDQGRVLGSVEGKVSFLKKNELKKVSVRRGNFAKYAPTGAIVREKKFTDEAEALIREQQELISCSAEATRINTYDEDSKERKTPVYETEDLIPSRPVITSLEEEVEKEISENTAPVSTLDETDLMNLKEAGMEVPSKEEEPPVSYLFGDLFAEDEIEEEKDFDELGEI